MSELEVFVCIFIIETTLPREEIELWSGCDNSNAFFYINHLPVKLSKRTYPTCKRTSWQRRSDVFLSVSTTSQVRLKWNTQRRLGGTSPRSQWYVSTTSLRNIVTTSQEYVTTTYHWYISKTSQTSLKWNTQRRLDGASPRRLSGTSLRCRTRRF